MLGVAVEVGLMRFEVAEVVFEIGSVIEIVLGSAFVRCRLL